MASSSIPARPSAWELFLPKLVTVLQRGYGAADLRADLVAGLTVAIVALPLSMALAVASGTTPDKGLVTAIVAGFLISALGGSRVQIGGPTGAFVVVVFNVIAEHGYDGLVLTTLLAGLMVAAAGLLRLGTYIKYIPQPVVVGFTAGIAVIIFTSQVGDFLGLALADPPAEVLARWQAYAAHLGTLSPAAAGLGIGALALIVLARRYRPGWPGFLLVILLGGGLAYALGLPVETIGSRFGAIPNTLPSPALPEISVEQVVTLLPDAATIALLAAIESLLSAVVADGMTGGRHRANCELVAQGVANVASALFGGLPATGAIARTATNVRAGARSPVAGMLHAVFLLLLMLAFAPLAVHVPMAVLAAVLLVVAWNMSEAHRLLAILRLAPVGDRVILVATFALTVLVDLTVAIQVGVVLSAIVFMHRMAEVVLFQSKVELVEQDQPDRTVLPTDPLREAAAGEQAIEVFEIRGPLFFGAAGRLGPALDRAGAWPKVMLLRLAEVPFIDSTGAVALDDFLHRCRRQGTAVIVTGMSRALRRDLVRFGLSHHRRRGATFVTEPMRALALARRLAERPQDPA
jgi:SulP family sulfate permease